MKDEAPALDLSNDMKPKDYNTHFVRAPHPNKSGPTNDRAKQAPTLEEATKGIYRK